MGGPRRRRRYPPRSSNSGWGLLFVVVVAVGAFYGWVARSSIRESNVRIDPKGSNSWLSDQTMKVITSSLRSSSASSHATTTALSAVSLWLMPPPPERTRLRQQIRRLAITASLASGSPPVLFEPHVTVVGGIPFRTGGDEIAAMLKKLSPLEGFGPVRCDFEPKPAFGTDDAGLPVWNQAAVLVLKSDDENNNNNSNSNSETENGAVGRNFGQLCKEVRSLLGIPSPAADGEEGTPVPFPPPLRRPHMSLYYGVDDVPRADEIGGFAESFEAHHLELWRTWPSGGADDVKDWEWLGTIDLV
jgi:hypothetical protein